MLNLLTGFLLLATIVWPVSTHAQDTFTDPQKDEIRAIVQDYILENPEIVFEAIQILREKQEAEAQARAEAALADNQNVLTHDPNSPVGGNPEGDITIVEFFDYRCGYCKRAHPTVREFLETDGNVRFVYKEWPILGPESVVAARAALASRNQDKYHEFHDRLMEERNVTEQSIKAAALEIGLDWEQLEADMGSIPVTAHIEDSMRLAQALGINGTPAFVIGTQLVPGAVDAGTLHAIVEEEREKR